MKLAVGRIGRHQIGDIAHARTVRPARRRKSPPGAARESQQAITMVSGVCPSRASVAIAAALGGVAPAHEAAVAGEKVVGKVGHGSSLNGNPSLFPAQSLRMTCCLSPDGDRNAEAVVRAAGRERHCFAARNASRQSASCSAASRKSSSRAARRRPVKEAAVAAVAAQQMLALVHAGGIDPALDLLGQAHGLPPLSRQKATSGCDSKMRSPQDPAVRSAVCRSPGFWRRCRRPGSRHRAADRMCRARRRLPGDAPHTMLRACVKARVSAWTAARDGIEKTLDWRCSEQSADERFRPAAAMAGKVGQADRHVDGDDGVVRQGLDKARKRSRRSRPTASSGAEHRNPARRAAVDADQIGDGRGTPHARRSFPGCVRWRSCTMAIGCDRLCASVSSCNSSPPRLAVRARISIDRGRGRLQRLGDRLSVKQPRQQHRRRQVAQPVRRACRWPGARRAAPRMRVSSRLPMPPAIIAGADVTSIVARPGIQRGGKDRAHIVELHAAQPFELVAVGRGDVGDRHQPVAHRLGHAARRHRGCP